MIGNNSEVEAEALLLLRSWSKNPDPLDTLLIVCKIFGTKFKSTLASGYTLLYPV
jgi:hypothetical protein